MKIEKEPPSFKPLVITLQSMDEVSWLYDLMQNVGGVGKERDFFDSISRGIEATAETNTFIGYRHENNIFGHDQAIKIK